MSEQYLKMLNLIFNVSGPSYDVTTHSEVGGGEGRDDL